MSDIASFIRPISLERYRLRNQAVTMLASSVWPAKMYHICVCATQDSNARTRGQAEIDRHYQPNYIVTALPFVRMKFPPPFLSSLDLSFSLLPSYIGVGIL